MATPKYDALVTKIRDWSNKDSQEALPDQIIKDSLVYAADTSYRLLKLAVLEHYKQYDPFVKNADGIVNNKIDIPSDSTGDLLRIAVFRGGDENNIILYNKRESLAVAGDFNASRNSGYYFTRELNQIVLLPYTYEGDVAQLIYYRRLPALNATYTVNTHNRDLLPFSDGSNLGSSNTFLTVVSDTTTDSVSLNGVFYTGNEAYNWLRDEQEQILLYGSLSHIANYTKSDGTIFNQLFTKLIDDLNTEENKRNSSGAILRVNNQNFDRALLGHNNTNGDYGYYG